MVGLVWEPSSGDIWGWLGVAGDGWGWLGMTGEGRESEKVGRMDGGGMAN